MRIPSQGGRILHLLLTNRFNSRTNLLHTLHTLAHPRRRGQKLRLRSAIRLQLVAQLAVEENHAVVEPGPLRPGFSVSSERFRRPVARVLPGELPELVHIRPLVDFFVHTSVAQPDQGFGVGEKALAVGLFQDQGNLALRVYQADGLHRLSHGHGEGIYVHLRADVPLRVRLFDFLLAKC